MLLQKKTRLVGGNGFTLIELMISLAIAAIIAMIAVPSYRNFIDRSKMRTAQADLVSLSVVIENAYQRQLSYPVFAANTTLPISDNDLFNSWNPSSSANDFTFTVESDSADGYTIIAVGAGALNGCSIELSETSKDRSRSTEGCTLGNGEWL